MSFKDLVEAGKDVKILWHYKEGDELIENKGEDMAFLERSCL
jgi:hypothetical protein